MGWSAQEASSSSVIFFFFVHCAYLGDGGVLTRGPNDGSNNVIDAGLFECHS